MVVFASASEVRGPQLQIERRESHWLLRAGNRFEKRSSPLTDGAAVALWAA
jgi:hypothetical protein